MIMGKAGRPQGTKNPHNKYPDEITNVWAEVARQRKQRILKEMEALNHETERVWKGEKNKQ